MTLNEIIDKIDIKPYYQDEWCVIYHADCRDILPLIPDKSIDLVLTDPPYPDQHPEYGDCDISILTRFGCRQLIFWSAKVDFPLNYTAIHIWYKQLGIGSYYERIFERNGQHQYKLYVARAIACQRQADYTHDIFYNHDSQKPARIISALINEGSKSGDLILDPFLGSGTTCYCAKKLNRYSIGIEIEEKYCEIAAKRCSQSVMRLEV